jgi:hypothetical protein
MELTIRMAAASVVVALTAFGCGAHARPERSTAASASSGAPNAGSESTLSSGTLDALSLPTSQDRTITTRERCVLDGNCDDELARLENARSPQDQHRRAYLLALLCDSGSLRYCGTAALAGVMDPTVDINVAVARRRASMACNATHTLEGCMALAAIPHVAAAERQRRGLPADPSDGVGDTTMVAARDANGAVRVESVTQSPAPTAPERAVDVARMSPRCRDVWQRCEGGDGRACAVAATCFVNGSEAPLDQARAANLYRRSCTQGTPEACTELGIMMLQGEGIPRDVAGARAAYEQACDGGDMRGCSEAGIMFAQGEGGPADRVRGRQLLEMACGGGHTHACAVLSVVIHDDAQGSSDLHRAERLARGACQRGDAFACTVVRQWSAGP